MTGREIIELIRRYRIPLASEIEMQDMIERVLQKHGVAYVRECCLSSRDRVDFLCGTVAVECKIAGSPVDVLSQLQRYSEHDGVSEIVLVTSRRNHAFEATVNGKILEVYRVPESLGG